MPVEHFVQQMRDWFMQNEDRIAYAAYFDVDGQFRRGEVDGSQETVICFVVAVVCDVVLLDASLRRKVLR